MIIACVHKRGTKRERSLTRAGRQQWGDDDDGCVFVWLCDGPAKGVGCKGYTYCARCVLCRRTAGAHTLSRVSVHRKSVVPDYYTRTRARTNTGRTGWLGGEGVFSCPGKRRDLKTTPPPPSQGQIWKPSKGRRRYHIIKGMSTHRNVSEILVYPAVTRRLRGHRCRRLVCALSEQKICMWFTSRRKLVVRWRYFGVLFFIFCLSLFLSTICLEILFFQLFAAEILTF